MPTPTKPLVRVTRPLPGEFLVPDADIRFGPEKGFPDRADFTAFAKGAAAIVAWVNDRIDGAMLDAIGHDLRIVANFAVGYDNIDLEACRERNVRVSNTPDAVTEGTADVAVMLMLAAARKLAAADRFARSGAWERHGILGPNEWMGLPLAGRTLLIVGAGRIGYATAIRTLGWGMKVLYTARHPKPNFEHAPLNALRVDLDEGLARADVVSLHVPLSSATRHIIDERRLALMKPTAILVNTGRGPLVDEAALVDALKNNRLFGAGLDVMENEPKLAKGLAELDNVAMTPHYGSASTSSRGAMSALCAANIRAVLAGHEPVTPVV
jgi:glyoxylate reductase